MYIGCNLKYLTFILTLFLSLTAQAGTNCTGKIERLGFSPTSGDVHLQIQPSAGIFRVCNLDNAVGGITANVCKNMYSTFLAARISGKNVTLVFSDSVSCSSLGSWEYAASAPYYFEIEQNF